MNHFRFSRASVCLTIALICAGFASHVQSQTLDARGDNPQKATIVPPLWQTLSPPPEQTVDGVRVRLRAICWCRANQLDLPADQYVEQDDAMGLAVRYEVRGDAVTEGKTGTLTQARIYGASGAPNSALAPQSNIAPQGSGGVLFWAGANPRWKKATLDLEWRGASQSENAEGKFSAPVEFEVPVPAQTDVPQAATGQWRSVHGTQYFMRNVMVATKPFKAANKNTDWRTGFYFAIQRQRPPAKPGSDTFPDLDESRPEVIAVAADGTQTELKSEFGGSWGLGNLFDSKKSTVFDQGHRFNYTKPLPSGTKSVRIRFTARESSDDWRNESALQKFQFPLDLSRVPLPPVDAAWKPVATARGQRLEVALDQWRDVGKGFTARLMTRDLAHPDDARRLWLLHGSKLSIWNDAEPVTAKLLEHEDWKTSSGYQGVYNFTGPSSWWWRPNGTPIVGSSNERDVTFTRPTAAQTDETPANLVAAPFNIEGTWDEWLAVEHDWTLENLPIPQPGKSIIVNRELRGDGARLILRKLTAFDEKHRVAGIDSRSGIEASFEVLQTALPNARLDPEFIAPKQGQQQIEVRDNKGRELHMFTYDISQNPRWTIEFTLPASDAKTLSLHLTLTESALTGASETLTLRDLPQPIRPRESTF